jgi:hypothetical protein
MRYVDSNGLDVQGDDALGNVELAGQGIYRVIVFKPPLENGYEYGTPILKKEDYNFVEEWPVVKLPNTETTPPPARILTRLAFLDRFSVQELTTLYTAAPASPQIQVWLDMYRVSDEINLDDARLIAGVEGLENAGIIGVGRAAQVLA